MRTHELLIIQHFLRKLEESVENEQLQDPINLAFLHLLERDEIIDFLAFMCGGKKQLGIAHPDFQNVSKETLLFEYIRDEHYMAVLPPILPPLSYPPFC